MYLLGLWFGEDQRLNNIKMHVSKGLDDVFKIYQLVQTQALNTIRWTYVFDYGIKKHTLS